MTDRTPDPRRATPQRKRVARVPHASSTALGAGALFVGALGTIGVQMARGHDPSLGAGKPVAAASTPARTARPVIEKRIVRKVVVTRVVTDPPSPSPAPAAASAPAAPVVQSAPVVRTSAPVPAPAPAPAPVQSATS